jgi:phage-related protein
VGSSLADLRALPAEVKDVLGFALQEIKTPKPDLDLIKQRLKLAQDWYETLVRDDI